MLKVYGAPFTRAGRTFWMLEELGEPYESISKDPRQGETRTPDMMALNPNGHVPILQDGDHTMWESIAINLYLAKKYDKLWPSNIEDQGHTLQWSFWAMTEAEPPLISLLMHSMFLPEDQRDPATAEKALADITAPLATLEISLDGKDYLVGGGFSVADLNVCSVLGFAHYVQYDFSPYPNIGGWLQRCGGRPACQKMNELAQQAMAG